VKKILFISTGGTFNKHYDPDTGAIAIDTEASALRELAEKWRTELHYLTIIGKDSLEMDDADRRLLLQTIQESAYKDIIVIHGTDTMALSASVIEAASVPKRVVFTGAMIPYRVDKVEATANVAMAYGYLQGDLENGTYISMNGIIGPSDHIEKNREAGRFELV